MTEVTSKTVPSRCMMCPAGCEVNLVASGPDMWRTEYPTGDEGGLCPRGSALGELLGHPRRIREPMKRISGRLERIDLATAIREILDAAAGRGVTFILDGSLPCEQLVQGGAWCKSWDGAQIAFAIEPSERQLLMGLESSSPKYLDVNELSECDGFLIIGDAFAANPICAKGVLDRRKQEPRTPVVVIDPGSGAAVKFATHRVETSPGGAAPALAGLAAPAGLPPEKLGSSADLEPSAESAGRAIANCRRLGVLIAAEYGRTDAWGQIGRISARLGASLGGGVCLQTDGANALGALRVGERLGAIGLYEATRSENLLVAIGCDVLGMLGRTEPRIFAAGAALPNRTTEQAQIVLPVALPCELAGTYLQSCGRKVQVSALLSPPLGVGEPVSVIASLAEATGVGAPVPLDLDPLSPLRIDADEPVGSQGPLVESAPSAPAGDDPPKLKLLLGRQTTQAGCGALTGWGSWAGGGDPDLRMSAPDTQALKLKNLQRVTVSANGKSLSARLRVAPELRGGVIVLPEGSACSRDLLPCIGETETGILLSVPGEATVVSE